MGLTNDWKPRWRVGVALLIVGLVAGMGCEKPRWDDPSYISKELTKGNSTEQTVAIKKVADQSEEIQKKVVPALVKVYNQENANQKKAMQILVKLRVPEAKEAYMKELKSDATGYAGAAAEALGETQTTEAIPEMLEFYKSTHDGERKVAILRGFSHMPDKRMADQLVETLKLSVDNNRIALHSWSCQILGETLVRAQFLSNNKGQNVQKECSVAIQKLGQPAVPVLVETFHEKNEAVNDLMMKYRNDSAQFPSNRAKVGAIQRLTSLRADKAVDLFLEELDRTIETPKALPKKYIRPWWKFEAQSIDEMILGLGDLGATKAKETLEATVLGKNNEKWSAVLDPQLELQIRQDAAFALVRLGARDSTDVLMEMAKTGVIKKLERRAMALEKSEKMEPMKPIQRYQFNWMNAKAYALLATAEDMKAYQALVDGLKDEKRKPVKERLKTFTPMIELAKKCHAKGSDQKTAECFGEALGSDDENVRLKAAWELKWMDTKVAGPVLVDNLDTPHLGTREILTLGLYDHPQKKAIEKIDTILEDESNQTADSYKLDHYRLKLLRAWLKNHFA
ncbi:MAG: HEAT repeat domain-containing protein [Bradymonadaceae bacterium]